MSSVRIWGVVAAVVLAGLFGWVVWATFGAERVVVPEVAVRPAGEPGAAVGALLANRTRLQDEASVATGTRVSELYRSKGTLAFVPEPGSTRTVDAWTKQLPADRDRFMQTRDFREGRASLPYRETNVLVQPQGRGFRGSHNDTIRHGGGWLIFGVGLVLAAFLAARGRIPMGERPSGTHVVRFNALERTTHWMTATSFLAMAVTGLAILYGKPLLIPLIGERAFSSVAYASAWIHMALAVPFVTGITMMALMWMRANIPSRVDWEWLKAGGGFLRDDGQHPPAPRFNAGQKGVFWGVVLGGFAMLATGINLMFPFYWLGYDGMQWSQLLHGGIGVALVALIIGHIYIGTVGMVGAFQAMWSGLVDRTWARQHHSLWYDRVVAEAHDSTPRD